MGLDWNPANKPIPGREKEYEVLLAAVEAEADDPDYDPDLESEASRKFFAASISAFDTLDAPTIGIDEIANDWAKQQYKEAGADDPFEVWFEKARGIRLVHLVPNCPGIPRYSNGSVAGYVEPYSFRAQFLTLCEDIVGPEVLEQCYERMSASELVEFGRLLKAKGEGYAAKSGVSIPPESEEFDENAPEWRADILVSAGEWAIYWGERGHPLDPYW